MMREEEEEIKIKYNIPPGKCIATSPETRSPPSIFPFDDDVETRSPPSICPFDDDIICIQPTVGIEGGA